MQQFGSLLHLRGLGSMPAVQSAATIRSNDVTVSGGQPLPGLVRAFRFGADASAEELAVDQPIAEHDGWLWLHFNLAAPALANT